MKKEKKKDAPKHPAEPVRAAVMAPKTANVFGTSVINSFGFLKFVLQFSGRFPIYLKQRKQDNVYEFYHDSISPAYVAFIVTAVALALQFALFVLNVWGVLLNFPPAVDVKQVYKVEGRNVSDGNASEHYAPIDQLVNKPRNTIIKFEAQNIRAYEMYVTQRNLVAIIVLLCAYTQAIVHNFSFHNKMTFACQYLTFLTTAVENMRIDAAHGLATKMFWFLVMYFFYLALIVVYSFTQFAPTTRGTASVFTMFHVRVFQFTVPKPWFVFLDVKGFKFYSSFLAISILFCFWNSKCYVFLYYWNCKLIRNSFKVFNHRLERVLHRGEYLKSRTEKVANRTGYDHLFRDHGCLLDMIDGADLMYAHIINSFFANQIITLCFEFFHAWQSLQSKDEFRGARKLDSIVFFTQFLHSLYICTVVSLEASSINDEAYEGLQIIRRKGMLGHKEDEELYFMMSMYVSYTGHLDTALSAGGYGTINKEFMVGIFATMLAYFIILFQFTPSLKFDHLYLLRDLKSNEQAVGLSEKELVALTEGEVNPLGQGRTFMTFDGLSLDNDGNVFDAWDFVHSFEFSQYLNTSVRTNAFDLT